MAHLPNPGTIRATFDTWAEASAATVLAPITRIFVGALAYEADAAGTALTTNGGARKWSPARGLPATLLHWGVTGTQIAPLPSGGLNTPATDERARIQEALDWCGANGVRLIGDISRVYGVSGPLNVGGAGQLRTWSIEGINLKVISWSEAVIPLSGDDPDAWEQDAAVLTFGPNAATALRGFVARDIHIDCSRLAGTGVRYRYCGQSNFIDIRVDQAKTFGHDVGRPEYGATTEISCTGCTFTGLRSREFFYSADPADGYIDWTVRTSCGLRAGGSDVGFFDCVIDTAKVCLALGRGYNVGFDFCRFWGNPSAQKSPAEYSARYTAVISKHACNFRFVNCRIEDGKVAWHGSLVPLSGGGTLPAFQGSFIGCSFSQYNNAQLEIIAYEIDETATNAIFIGNRQRTSQGVSLLTSGSGTWSDFRAEWVGNTNENGDAWPVQGKSMNQGYFAVYTNGRVRAAALTPTPATPGDTATWCVGSDGTLYTYGSGNWYAHTGTLVT